MSKTTAVLILMVLNVLSAASLATVGLLSAQPLFYVFAIWGFALAILIFFIFTYRMYQRVGNHTRYSNDLLREIKFLQERRYEQLASRLDAHSTSVQVGTRSGHQPLLHASSEIANINARFQRAERRILGQLENNSLDINEQMRKVEELFYTLREAPKDAS